MDSLTGHLTQISDTLHKRNAALKEVRSTLQKTEEERDENWRRLQLEIREKRSLTAKVKELSEALELSDQKLRQSEGARKALAKTLQRQTLDKPADPPKLQTLDDAALAPPQSLEEAYKLALEEIEHLQTKFEDERRRRLELKAAAKRKFDEHEAEISALKAQAEAARGWAEKCEEMAALRQAELDEIFLDSENLRLQVRELDDFKKQAMKQWMLSHDKQLSG